MSQTRQDGIAEKVAAVENEGWVVNEGAVVKEGWVVNEGVVVNEGAVDNGALAGCDPFAELAGVLMSDTVEPAVPSAPISAPAAGT